MAQAPGSSVFPWFCWPGATCRPSPLAPHSLPTPQDSQETPPTTRSPVVSSRARGPGTGADGILGAHRGNALGAAPPLTLGSSPADGGHSGAGTAAALPASGPVSSRPASFPPSSLPSLRPSLPPAPSVPPPLSSSLCWTLASGSVHCPGCGWGAEPLRGTPRGCSLLACTPDTGPWAAAQSLLAQDCVGRRGSQPLTPTPRLLAMALELWERRGARGRAYWTGACTEATCL